MNLRKAQPEMGLGLVCPAKKQRTRQRRPKAGGYVSEEIHEALRAYCWYCQITQSELVASLVVTQIEQLQSSGKLTPQIIDLYRANRRKPIPLRTG